MKRLLTLLTVLFLSGGAMACTSVITEIGVESRFTSANPYTRIVCNILVPTLDLTKPGLDGEEVEYFSVWVRPEVYLTTQPEFITGKISLLVDVPWAAQFIVSIEGSYNGGPLLLVGYRHVW